MKKFAFNSHDVNEALWSTMLQCRQFATLTSFCNVIIALFIFYLQNLQKFHKLMVWLVKCYHLSHGPPAVNIGGVRFRAWQRSNGENRDHLPTWFFSKNCELSASCELYLRHITLVTRPEDEHISGTRKQITTSKQESKGPSWRPAEKVSALSCFQLNCLTLQLHVL